MSTPAQVIYRKLRPPSARPLAVTRAFSSAQTVNPGYTVLFYQGETTALCMGDGTVVAVQPVAPFWAYTPGSQHASYNAIQVVVDHGQNIRTVFHGLSSSSVTVGQAVLRGQALGTLLVSDAFFAILENKRPVDPASVSRHFRVQDGQKAYGQGNTLRSAPDPSVRDFSAGIMSTIVAGVRYFTNALCTKPALLVNIAFNGNGSKTGLAYTGFTASDYWNNYAPSAFSSSTVTGAYCSGTVFTDTPIVYLNDYTGNPTAIWLERVKLTASSGTSNRFDPMLSRWVGGYDGLGVAMENTFSLRSVPPGNYVLDLYANEGTPPNTSSFYVSVNGGAPTVKTNTPTITPTFVLDGNVAQFSFALVAVSTINVKAYGYLAGLQLKRV